MSVLVHLCIQVTTHNLKLLSKALYTNIYDILVPLYIY